MISYEYKNNNSSFVLLFVHGWGVDSSSLKPIVLSIKDTYSYISFDLNGFGKSPLKRPFTLDDYCIEINEVMKKHNINKVYGISHSFGGKVLLRYCELFTIERMILISPSIYKPPFSFSRFFKIYGYKLFKKMKWKLPSSLKGSRDYKNTTGYLRETFLNVCSYYFSKKRLDSIDKKIFLVGFNQDKEVNKKSLIKVKKYLKNSELYLYDGDHFGYLNKGKEIRVIISYMVNE